jgi:hypothetical protein
LLLGGTTLQRREEMLTPVANGVNAPMKGGMTQGRVKKQLEVVRGWQMHACI